MQMKRVLREEMVLGAGGVKVMQSGDVKIAGKWVIIRPADHRTL